MRAILLSVQLLLAEPGDIQEYKVQLVMDGSGLRKSYITTDKRFYEGKRGNCVIVRYLNKERIYFGGSC